MTRTKRMIVLGIDGLDPSRVASMIRLGELPNLARLQRTGTLQPLATSNPAESPVAWSNLATGCDSGQHGIFDFLHRRPGGYVPYLATQREKPGLHWKNPAARFVPARRAPGFWHYTSRAEIPTTVVRWPVTFPAEEVRGNFLSGLGVPDILGRMGRHLLYTTERGPDDDDKVIRVAWRGGQIETYLPGPPIPTWRGVKPSRVSLCIQRQEAGDDGAVRLLVGARDDARNGAVASEGRPLRVGEWSDWASVRFTWGHAPLCRGIFKARLVSLEPELTLFVTPLQVDPREQLWPITSPVEYGSQLADDAGLFYTLGLPEDTHAVTDGRYDLDGFLQQCTEIGRERTRMFHRELNRFDDGLLAFVFDAGDRIQHMCWSVADPQSPSYSPEAARKYEQVVPDLYREMDHRLGDALEACRDDDAVLVVSDHGFGPFHRAVHLNRWLIENGFMALRKRAGSGAGGGRNLFADVDWSRTRAYALGFASIYLNRRGRESKGILDSNEAGAVGRALAAKLCNLKDVEGGGSVVRGVYDASELYHGPYAGEGPDLVVGYERGYRASWQTALGGAPPGLICDNNSLWAADHLVDPSHVPGVLAGNLSLSRNQPRGVDLAPTVLAWFGLEPSVRMIGRSWLNHAGQAPVALHDEPEWDTEVVPVTAGVEEVDDAERMAIEKRLADLGYL